MKRKLLLVLTLFCAFQLTAQMPGWSYIQPILVTENSGALVTDYQLQLTVNTQDMITAGHLLADGSDLRFTKDCGGTLLFSYWIESGINTPTTKVWVKIDTLQANANRVIYMQYGNALATAVSQIAGTFIGPHSSTDSVASGGAGGATTSQRGFRFAPTQDLLFSHIGKREPNGTTRYVTLFDFATQAILSQGQVSGPAAQFSYASVPNPIWLTSGTQYILELYQGASDGYYFGTSSQIGQHLTYLDMRYCNSCTQNTFPTNTLTNYHYGTPDFWYFTKNTITPAPTYSLTYTGVSATLADQQSACASDTSSLVLAPTMGEAPYSFSWTGNGVIDGSNQTAIVVAGDTTEYFVQMTDACGLIYTDSITVNAWPLPNITIQSSAPVICNGEFAELSVAGNYNFQWDDNSTNDTLIVMPSVTTSYAVTATDSNLCSNTAVFQQDVNVPITGSQNVEVCAGQFFTYNNHSYGAAGSYLDTIVGVTNCDSIVTTNLTVNALPNGSQTIDVCAGGSYSIGNNTYTISGTYTDTISGAVCDSVVTTNLVVASPINTTVQISGITLTAQAGANAYQWINCANNQVVPGATANVFDPVANGNYAVIITEGNCSDTSSCSTISTIGVQELDFVENISVFPNPNNGVFTVQSSLSQTVVLTDALGHLIQKVELTSGQAQQLELKELNSGVYFLVSRTKVVRVVVE
ncbi:MAG: DUF2341 domain-containing protein [Fluviicola sp.]|nr:DUF2341 domain-containing protein [Fluviicola sp.]